MDDRITDEEGAVKCAGEAQVFDENTRYALPPALVAKAREEEVSMMESWGVRDVITQEKAWGRTGQAL